MQLLLTRLAARRWLWLIAGVLTIGAEAVGVFAQPRQKQVLVLYSTRRDSQIAIIGERDLPRILDDGLSETLDYYSEFIDQARFPDPSYKATLREFLRSKYRDQRFDLVITMDEIGLDFFSENRSELFPNTPIVSYVIAADRPQVPNATGIVARLDFGGTIGLALALQPEIKNVFVVAGVEPGTPTLAIARTQFQPFESRLAFTYLLGLKDQDLQGRLATLPPQSIVYYLFVNRDAAGENFHPLEYLDRVVHESNAPVYCWVDSAMSHGIIGGNLKSQQAEVEALGALALRVLHGAHAGDIPWSSPDLNISQVNWRELQRWNISESRVPAGTVVRFRDPSVWDRYGVYIAGAAIVLLAQTILIASLIVQRSRRQRAEAQVRGSQVELRRSYDRIRDLGGRLLNAQEAERSRIARDLHDDIGQQVALLAIDLELLAAQGNTVPAEALNRAQDLARSVHDLSHRLHPAKLRLIGVVPALQGLQHETSQAGIPTSFEHDHVPSALPPEVTLCLFRIVQEALQNANKYSRASLVRITLHGGANGLALTVVDDGVGFDVDSVWGKGLGLISMRERVEAIGGTMTIASAPDAGTRLEVNVPLRADSA